MTALLATDVHHSPTVADDPWGKRLSLAALCALPVVTLAILLMLPADANTRATTAANARKALAATDDHRAGVWIGMLLIGLLYLLVMPALQTVVQAVTGRGRALVRIGYVFTCVGACALAFEDAVVGVSLRAATAAGLDRDAMVSYTVALQKEGGPLSPIFWLMLPFFIGIVLMAIGVVRSPALRWWHGLLLVLSMASLVAAAPDGSGYVALALVAAFAASMVTRVTRA